MDKEEAEQQTLLCCREMDQYIEQGYVQRSRGFKFYTACLWNGEFRKELSFHRNAVIKFCPFCGTKL